MTPNTTRSGTLFRVGALLLLTLLLTPLSLQAQNIGYFTVYPLANFRIGAQVAVSGSASHFPATITVDWDGDTTSSKTADSPDDSIINFGKTFAICGVKTVSVSVSFNGGASKSRSTRYTMTCQRDTANVGGVTCDLPSPVGTNTFGCRSVPTYFTENQQALHRSALDGNRRPLSSYGYRCPDVRGLCGSTWLPGPARNTGLSDPGRFVVSAARRGTGTNVQRINAAGIGVQSINDQRPIDAVDIWGPGAEDGGEVCFHGTEGRLIYLDARTSPRAQSELSTTVRNEKICGTMPGPGSVVYLPPAG